MSWPGPTPIRKPRLWWSISYCAQQAGVHRLTMKRLAIEEGIAQKVAGRLMISTTKVKQRWPDLWERMMEDRYEREQRELARQEQAERDRRRSLSRSR